LQIFQFLTSGVSGATLKVIYQRLESLFDYSSGDIFALIRLIGSHFLRSFHRLGKFDLCIQRFNLVGLGMEKGVNQVFIGNKSVMPAGGDNGLEVIADLLPPVHEHPCALELIEHTQGDEFIFERG